MMAIPAGRRCSRSDLERVASLSFQDSQGDGFGDSLIRPDFGHQDGQTTSYVTLQSGHRIRGRAARASGASGFRRVSCTIW